MSNLAPPFLVRYLPPRSDPSSSRPTITVTWAQSLDAKIAGPGGARVILSGPESMAMTHWMRTMHETILVGINTIIMDDPRLKSRHKLINPPVQLVPQEDKTLRPPQPLILDPKLRFPLSARILSEWNTNRGDPSQVIMQPWIVCGHDVSSDRVREVEEAGARVVQVSLDKEGRIPPNLLPQIMSDLRLHSVMIEGGSKILSAFLRAPPREDGSPLVDNVIVTVAPMFIGDGIGVVPDEDRDSLPTLKTSYTEAMGKDAVMVCTIAPK